MASPMPNHYSNRADKNGLDAAERAWDLGRLASVYSEFSANFGPFLQAVESLRPSPLQAFRLRILLIHAWRRAILRDPLLPEELLPAAWPGAEARLLCRKLYRKLHALAEAHLAETTDAAICRRRCAVAGESAVIFAPQPRPSRCDSADRG